MIAPNSAHWNSFVRANHGSFLQTLEWSQFQQSLNRPVHNLASADANTAKWSALAIVLPMPLRRKFLYLPRGPVVDLTNCDFRQLTKQLRISAKSLGTDFVRADWPLPARPDLLAQLKKSGWRHVHATQPEHTSIVALAPDEEELLDDMHPKTRYNIRLAEKHGVTVRQGSTPADLEIFLKLFKLTTVRDGFSGHEPSYYRKMIESLASGDVLHTPKAFIIIAEVAGTPAAAGVFLDFADTRTYLHGASDHDLRQSMAPFALHWQAIKTAKAAGLRRYDFWGVAPENAGENHPWAGITRFKLGFGGKSEAYAGTWELPVRRWWYTVERAVKRLSTLLHP